MSNENDYRFERGSAYVVDRGDPVVRSGQGMFAGLGVVIKHFRDAFTKKLTDPSQTSGVYTVQYPEERTKLPEAFRNFPILLYEDASGQELCTSCFQCERICPPQVIHISQAKDPATGKSVPAAAEFLIEYDACMSCGLCAEVCPFDAIKMDHTFELATDQHGGLTIDKAGLMKPISYYESLAPSFWGEVKDGALKKLQGAAKRRTGLIGIAPQMAETVQAQQAAAPAPVRTPTPAPAAKAELVAPATPASDDAQAAKAAKLAAIRAANAAKAAGEPPEAAPAPEAPASDDPKAAKAAKLAAIRAANAAKVAGEPAEAAAPPVAAPEVPASDDPKAAKAAKLAAIRAANAAKAAGEAAAELPVAAAAAEVPPAAPPVAAPEVPASDDPKAAKAAKLAAIRAANAAKKAAEEAGE
jgi:NADH-quinone oxidoreductase subunit I/electron transport complex protein RnfC